MAKSQRTKGASGERAVARLWQKLGFSFARRNLDQYQESSGSDIKNIEPFVCQVKTGKRVNVWQALDEAVKAAKAEDIPLAMVKQDRKDWLVVIRWADFVRVVKDPKC